MSRLTGRRRNRRRRNRGQTLQRIGRAVRVGTKVAAVAAVVGWGVPAALRHARAHPYFALGRVEIHHRGHLSEEAIRAATGLREGMSIWDVDVDVVRRSVERLPWVRSARVTRRLPARVTVRLREYRPAAIVHLEGTEPPLRYVATNGRIFAPVADVDGRDLPYITGIDATRVAAGTAVHEIRAAMQALHVAARHRGAIGSVSEVHVDADRGLTVMPVRPTIAIELGWGEVEAALAHVADVLPHWLARAGDVRSVRRWEDDQIIVRLRAIPKEWGT